MMAGYWRDLTHAIRVLVKSAPFTAVATVMIATGIGATVVMFSIVSAVALRPLPFGAPERLVQVWATEPAPGIYPLTGPDYLDIQSRARTLESTTLYTWPRSYNSNSRGGQAEVARVAQTEWTFFSVLDVQPVLGRAFSRDSATGERVVIVSDGFWQRQFGGRREAVGETLLLDEEPYTVIGVMPSGFEFPSDVDAWTPMAMQPASLGPRNSHQFLALGRLSPGATLEQLRGELDTITKDLARQYPQSNAGVGAAVVPLREAITGDSRSYVWILFGAVFLVLLIACANVANLLLVRANARRQEMAVRAALGANRIRLIRQLLIESLALSLFGGVLGLIPATWLVRVINGSTFLPIPHTNPIRLDVAVVAFALAISAAVGVLFGLAPALKLSQAALASDLQANARAVVGGSSRLKRLERDGLVVAEIATALALLIGAGLLVMTYVKLHRVDIGLNPDGVVTMNIELPMAKYTTLGARRAFYDRVVERVGRLGGMDAVAVSSALPLEGGSNGFVTVDGVTDPALAHQLVETNWISADYFKTLGIPLVGGRAFGEEDVASTAAVTTKVEEMQRAGLFRPPLPADIALVAVINQAMARTYWPNRDAVGRIFKFGGLVPVQVIGVVADANQHGLRQTPGPQMYYPFVMNLGRPKMTGHLLIKSHLPTESVVQGARRAIAEIDPNLAISYVRTMREVIGESMRGTSAQTTLLSAFAAVGMLLAVIGIYAVMAHRVTQQTREIGIRMAMGADPRVILRAILIDGGRLALIGLAVGIGLATLATRVLAGALFGVEPIDVGVFAAAAVVLFVAALLASFIPARRAMRMNPVLALRSQ
jgi:putative ABC transport system permease protein